MKNAQLQKSKRTRRIKGMEEEIMTLKDKWEEWVPMASLTEKEKVTCKWMGADGISTAVSAIIMQDLL